jgi:hypothetical protein
MVSLMGSSPHRAPDLLEKNDRSKIQERLDRY